MFGTKAKIGLKSTLLPINIISNLRTEVDLEKALNSISTVSNSNDDIENKEGTYKLINIIPFNYINKINQYIYFILAVPLRINIEENLKTAQNSISTTSKCNNDIENKEGTYIYLCSKNIIIIPFNYNFRFLVSVFE